MFSISTLRDWIHQKAAYLPHLIGLLSIIVIIFLIILGRLDLLSKAGVILFPLIVISAYLIYNRRRLGDENGISYLVLSSATLTKIFFIVATSEIICLLFGNRDFIQLGLLFIMYLLIILQIFSRRVRPPIILAEIILTTAILVLPQLYISGYFYGDTDLIDHSNYATVITFSGGLPEKMFGTYQFFCMYHILTSIASQTIGFVSNDTLYLISTTAVISSIPVVYMISHHFTKSPRIAVLAAFFYSTLPMILGALLVPAPRVMASVAFILSLYFLLDAAKKNVVRFVFLTILVVTYMTGVHHAQILLIFAILAFLCLGSFLYFKKLHPGNTVVFAVLVLLPIVWQAYQYLESVIHSLEMRLFGQLEAGVITDTILTSHIFEFDWYSLLGLLSSGIMTILIFTGIYFLLTKLQHPRKIHILLPLLLVLFVFFVPGVADVIPTISSAFQLYRFRILLAPFFALVMAIGCYVLIHQSANRKKQIVSLGIVIVLCCLFVFSSAIVDNSMQSDVHNRLEIVSEKNYYTEADESVFSMITEYVENGNTIYSNREYAMYFASIMEGGHNYGLPGKLKESREIFSLFTEQVDDMSKYTYILLPYERYLNIGLNVLIGRSDYVELEYVTLEYDANEYMLFNQNTFECIKIYDNSEDYLYKC